MKLSVTKRLTSVVIALVAIGAVFASELFFSISGLIGYTYPGAGQSQAYIYFISVTSAFSLIIFITSCIKKPNFNRAEFGFYLFFALLLANHFLWVLLDNNNTPLWPKNLVFFVSMGITGYLASRAIHAYGIWLEVIKLSEILMVLMALGLIAASVIPFLSGGHVIGIGGASYQAASYYAAVCYGMIGLATFRLPKEYRLRILHNRVVALVNMTIMVALFMSVLINGGRGAFVLLVLYTTIVIYWIATAGGRTYNGALRFVAVLFVAPLLLVITFQKILSDPVLAGGWRRVTSFIGGAEGGLIDLEAGSSGRDRIYAAAVRGIVESPWIGYGAFGHWEKIIQPHNLFFDLALQFGIPVAAVIVVGVLAAVLVRLKKFRKVRIEQFWLLVLFLYPMVNLMVSSGYFRSSLFWFCLAGLFFTTSSETHPKNSRNVIAKVQ